MQAEKQFIEHVLDALHCGTWQWNLQTHEVILDERWAEILGYTLAELMPIHERTSVELSHPDDRDVARIAAEEHIAGKTERFSCEVRMRHKLGHWVWVMDNGRITERDAQGTPIKMIGARLDISSRKNAEEAYRYESERFKALTHTSNTGAWEWDQSTQSLWCSPEYFTMLGRDPNNYVLDGSPNIKTSWEDLLHPDDRDRAIRSFADYLASNSNEMYQSEFRLSHANGGWIWVWSRGSTLRDAQGKRTSKTLGTHSNISSLKETEFRLRESQDRLQMVSNNLPRSMMYQLDCGLNGEVRKFNYLSQGVEKIHDIPLTQALENANILYKQILPDYIDEFRRLEQESIDNLTDFKVEIRCRLPNDQIRWFLIISSPRKLENGHIVFDGLEMDITEQKNIEAEIRELNINLEKRVTERTAELQKTLENLERAQEQLLQNEKLASLGALVAGVAHELNTPIGNAMMVSTSMALSNKTFQAQVEQGLTRTALTNFMQEIAESSVIIERNLGRAAELICSFKQLAVDQTSYQRRAFNLHELSNEIALTMHPTLRKTPFQFVDATPDALMLDSYPGPLGQVLINLINNSLIHGFEGREKGTIHLSAQLSNDQQSVSIRLQDDGVGIPAKHLKKIFDPFFTTKLGQGGSGLGLHIIYTLVTGLLGGTIEVQSQENTGTTFTMHLPVIAPNAPPS